MSIFILCSFRCTFFICKANCHACKRSRTKGHSRPFGVFLHCGLHRLNVISKQCFKQDSSVAYYFLHGTIPASFLPLEEGFAQIDPTEQPFDITDRSISYPLFEVETITDSTLILVTLVAPAASIFAGSLFPSIGMIAQPLQPRRHCDEKL